MSFDNLPDLGPMLMPGASEYHESCIELAKKASETIHVEFDIAYGEDSFQHLDVWYPKGDLPEKMPVFLMIHGGAWRNGYKEWMGIHAPTLTSLPGVIVSPNYRLVPQVRMADAFEDCVSALVWTVKNIARFGGDPSRIIVGGHSAGAHFAALLALKQNKLQREQALPISIKACLPISGIFGLRKQDLSSGNLLLNFYEQFFASETEAKELTAFTFIESCSTPFIISFGEHEPADLLSDNRRMAEVLKTNGFLHDRCVFTGCDHFQAHLSCHEPDNRWFTSLRSLIKQQNI